jgi:CubicO group peptidase (beta-lactamase class C family)
MDHERIDRTLIAACNRSSLAGLAVGIVKNGSVVYAKGFGVADAARGIAITPDTSFRIGSISKTFTAIALMQLHEQERFQLDDPVSKYLRAYKEVSPKSMGKTATSAVWNPPDAKIDSRLAAMGLAFMLNRLEGIFVAGTTEAG